MACLRMWRSVASACARSAGRTSVPPLSTASSWSSNCVTVRDEWSSGDDVEVVDVVVEVVPGGAVAVVVVRLLVPAPHRQSAACSTKKVRTRSGSSGTKCSLTRCTCTTTTTSCQRLADVLLRACALRLRSRDARCAIAH